MPRSGSPARRNRARRRKNLHTRIADELSRMWSNCLRTMSLSSSRPRFDPTTMIQFRKQYSVRTLMIVASILGVNFAWMPWPTCVVLAVPIIVAGFIARINLVECLVYAFVVLVLVAVSLPPHGGKRRIRRAPVAPPPAVAPADVSSGEVMPPSGSAADHGLPSRPGSTFTRAAKPVILEAS